MTKSFNHCVPEKKIKDKNQKRLRASVVCVRNAELLVVKYEDPTTKKQFWGVPGGAIEAGEEPAETARREVREETGYRIRLIDASHTSSEYPFTWDGKTYHCITHWFAASLQDDQAQPEQVDDAAYILECGWMSLNYIPAEFNYSDAIQKAVLGLLPYLGHRNKPIRNN